MLIYEVIEIQKSNARQSVGSNDSNRNSSGYWKCRQLNEYKNDRRQAGRTYLFSCCEKFFAPSILPFNGDADNAPMAGILCGVFPNQQAFSSAKACPGGRETPSGSNAPMPAIL
jgi:hypothetical protein